DLKVQLTAVEDGLDELDIRIVSKDKFLSPTAAKFLAFAPLPDGHGKIARRVRVTGAAPIWLYAAYSRWLSSSGVKEILVWDMGSKSYIRVYPPQPASGATSGG